MALKAGRVGVRPDQIDMAGQVKTPSTSYTKTEVNALLAVKADAEDLDDKVDVSDLTANNKQFVFAYDAESEKYGYKLDGEGDFHPFEEGGSGGIGWVKPPELINTGISFTDYHQYVSGGYYIENGVCYVDIVVYLTGNSNSSGWSLPSAQSELMCASGTTAADVTENYFSTAHPYISTSGICYVGSGTNVPRDNKYNHIWGEYPLAT